MLYEFTNKEQDQVINAFRINSFVTLRDLPDNIAPTNVIQHIQGKMKESLAHSSVISHNKKTHMEVLKKTVNVSNMTIEERSQYADSLKKAVNFQIKLFNNLLFTGELYIRRLMRTMDPLLPERSLLFILETLLGCTKVNNQVDDLVIEGAIMLMNKVGSRLCDHVKRTQNADRIASLKKIFDRFVDLKDTSPQNLFSNRVKHLIEDFCLSNTQ